MSTINAKICEHSKDGKHLVTTREFTVDQKNWDHREVKDITSCVICGLILNEKLKYTIKKGVQMETTPEDVTPAEGETEQPDVVEPDSQAEGETNQPDDVIEDEEVADQGQQEEVEETNQPEE